MNLAGRHVLITGGGRGIGLELALAAKRAGGKVTVLARSAADIADAESKLKEIGSTGGVCALRADVSDADALKRVLDEAVRAQGPIYGLVCAAGVYGALGAFSTLKFEDWAKTIDINLIGTARTIHAALPFMTLPEGARVVLFSGGGQGPMPNFSDYVTSKGAIWRLTETLGAELAAKRIFVNAIAPGAINTKLLDELLQAGPDRVGKDAYEKSLKQRDSGGQSPEKACELFLYLLSEKSTGLYGKTLSAIWDPYQQIENPEKLSQTDIYCYRRVVDDKGNTRG
jgi:NAD(P)-dependent dehydrogenase (short-subunit alcohol dehydrogenase family)